MKALSPLSILTLVVIVFVSPLTAGAVGTFEKPWETFQFAPVSAVQPYKSSEKIILDLINDFRRERNLSALAGDPSLDRLALSYSSKMARENFFSHYDSNGKNLTSRARDSKISWTSIAENLYFCKGIEEPELAAVKGWLKSPGHRANLLSRYWSATGIGIAETADGRFYATQIFIRR